MDVEVKEAGRRVERSEDMARIFRALGDPSRLAIYELIRDVCRDDSGHTPDELRNSVSEIARQFDLTLSTVSHHLKELRNAGLIRCERRGKNIFCSIDASTLEEVDRFIHT